MSRKINSTYISVTALQEGYGDTSRPRTHQDDVCYICTTLGLDLKEKSTIGSDNKYENETHNYTSVKNRSIILITLFTSKDSSWQTLVGKNTLFSCNVWYILFVSVLYFMHPNKMCFRSHELLHLSQFLFLMRCNLYSCTR